MTNNKSDQLHTSSALDALNQGTVRKMGIFESLVSKFFFPIRVFGATVVIKSKPTYKSYVVSLLLTVAIFVIYFFSSR